MVTFKVSVKMPSSMTVKQRGVRVSNIVHLLFKCVSFQGTVESIALKEPKERTKMFECISQSKELAAEYIKKKEALLKAKEDTQFHFNKKKSASVERKQMFRDKVEVSEGQSLFNS